MPGRPGFVDTSLRAGALPPPSAGLGRAPVLFPCPGSRRCAACESTLMEASGLRRLGGPARLLCTAVTAWAYRAAPSGHPRPHQRAQARAGPGRGSSRPEARWGICPLAGCPPPRHPGRLPAGRAHQPTPGIRMPARGHRPGPVVRLPQGRRIRKPPHAPRDVTPGGRHPDLITDDTALGDRHRIRQRIMTRSRPGRPSPCRPARQSQFGHQACPAPFRRRPGVPGQRPCPHPLLPHLSYAHASTMSPDARSRPDIQDRRKSSS
jgi:hypothetical protein